LRDLYQYFGDRRVVIARELTKKFESIYRAPLAELSGNPEMIKLKGEMVIVVEGCSD